MSDGAGRRFDASRPRGARVTLFVDDRVVEAFEGESIAAALLAAGIRALGGDGGRRRGYFCGMGVCHECRVELDGRRDVRACTTPVADGQRVRTGDAGGSR